MSSTFAAPSVPRVPRTVSAERLPAGPPLPRPVQTWLAWNRAVPYMAWCRRRYGPVFTIDTLPWGQAVVINDPALVKAVFTGSAEVLHAGRGNAVLAPVVGKHSVLVTDEQEHLASRKRMLPPFHGEAVRSFEGVVDSLTREEIARWPTGVGFPLHERMRALTFEVILRAVIGVTDPERASALRAALPASIELDFAIMLMWVHPRLGRYGRWRRYSNAVAEAHRLLGEEIAARRGAGDLAERGDILSR